MDVVVPGFGAASDEAAELCMRMLRLINEYGDELQAAGKSPNLKDVTSAVTGVLGSFIAGIDNVKVREDIIEKVGVLIRIAVDQSLAIGTGQTVHTYSKETTQ